LQSTYNRPPFRRQATSRPKKRPDDFWARLAEAISREHRVIEARDPRSSRIVPTLAIVGWVLR
jgi:hypothetical protein